MRITLTWLRLDSRRRWRSLLVVGLLVALATMTVLGAVAGARRGQTAISRLWALTLPATITVLPNEPGFDWTRIRALPEVAALTTFGVSGFAVDGYPLAGQEAGYPFTDRQAMQTIERPVVLQGRVSDPSRVDEVVVTPKFLVGYGKGVGDSLTLGLPSPGQVDEGYDPADGVPARGPRVRVRIVGVIRSFLFSDSVGSIGEVFPSPGSGRPLPGQFRWPLRHDLYRRTGQAQGRRRGASGVPGRSGPGERGLGHRHREQRGRFRRARSQGPQCRGGLPAGIRRCGSGGRAVPGWPVGRTVRLFDDDRPSVAAGDRPDATASRSLGVGWTLSRRAGRYHPGRGGGYRGLALDADRRCVAFRTASWPRR